MPYKQQKDIETRKRTQAENPINGGIQRPIRLFVLHSKQIYLVVDQRWSCGY